MPRSGPYLLYNYLYKSERVIRKQPYQYRRLTGYYSFGKKQAAVPTFKKAAETYYKENLPRWKAGPHTDVWLQPLEKYTFPAFGSKGVDQINRQDLLRLLTPIWTTVPQQAKRLRQRIRMILQWCVAHGFVEQNVCGEVLDGALPSMPVVKEHRRSLPYQDVHHALQLIDSCEATLPSKLCLHFLILTAVRPGEARNAEWSEIDFDNKVWAIPPRKMKINAEHRVPLLKSEFSGRITL